MSWSWTVPLAAAHRVVRQGQSWPTPYLALFGPTIAAVVVTARTLGRPGVRGLLARMTKWRLALRWWLVALSPVAFLGIALIMLAATGKALPGLAEFGKFSWTGGESPVPSGPCAVPLVRPPQLTGKVGG